MQKINYALEMEKTLAALDGQDKRLLLHVCCAPCASAVFEQLTARFAITAFYFNPNISPLEEYRKRGQELCRLALEMPLSKRPEVVLCPYAPEDFEAQSKGMELQPEGGERCLKCYRLRLEAAARYARDNRFDYFTTTLSISPYKNAQKLNEIGAALSKEYGVPYLYSDFKKKGGYLRSIALSGQYALYRQPYCGCRFSARQKALKDAQTP